MKKLSKSYIMSLCGAVLLVLTTIGFDIDVPYVNEVMDAICAVLILLGVITAPKTVETPSLPSDGADENAPPDETESTENDGNN